jgi:hypothetical protein
VVSFLHSFLPKLLTFYFSPAYVKLLAHINGLNLVILIVAYLARVIKYEAPRFLQSPIISSLLGPNIILQTLFLNPQSSSSLNARDQISHPYETTGKITDPYNLILVFIDQERKQKILN